MGARSLVASHRKTSGAVKVANLNRCATCRRWLRHISWSATASGKADDAPYQSNASRAILIAIDGGRLMTARIEQDNKLDSAVHAALA